MVVLSTVLCVFLHNHLAVIGVVLLPKGLWAKSTLNGRTSNALVSDAPTDVAGGATFNDARVQVERLGESVD